jgi:hypothetical protein
VTWQQILASHVEPVNHGERLHLYWLLAELFGEGPFA